MGEMALTRDVGIFAVKSGRPKLAGKGIVVICTACGRADRGSGGREMWLGAESWTSWKRRRSDKSSQQICRLYRLLTQKKPQQYPDCLISLIYVPGRGS